MSRARTEGVVTYNSRNRVRQPHVMAPINFNDRVVVPIYRLDGTFEPVFDLVFFGIPLNDFYVIPGGADPIFAALRRRGLDPADYTANMFEVRAGDNVYKRAPKPVTLWPNTDAKP